MPKRLHGYNENGEKDSIVGNTLPAGWTVSAPEEIEEAAEEEAEEAAEEAPKPRRGRPPKNPEAE